MNWSSSGSGITICGSQTKSSIIASKENWWSLKDVHDFCLKLCAMYATVDIAFPKELAEYNNGGTADFSTSSLD